MSSAAARLSPLADRIVVIPIIEEKTHSGIIIPDTVHKDRPERGKVVAVGPGKMGDDHRRIPLEVKVGEIVLFAKYGPDEISIGGVQYYILREEQLLAVIR
ncbi:MAG TPA: co-chaperone GroES [Candidatus Paceibacterota bacterium]|nr:co-chaperone GroES [Candidatus Paceibacterota bacterium]